MSALLDREQAIDAALAVLDDPLFKAMQEPARVAVIKQLFLLGRADVGQIAEKLPQERSVISRHLQMLSDAGIVQMQREGRHHVYQLDWPTVTRKFSGILQEIEKLTPLCCPPANAEDK